MAETETSHPDHLAHHFDSVEQQRESASFGMWLFIAQEIMFFGGLFLGYIVYRIKYPMAFATGSNLLSIEWGAFNTAVLIGSSLTMALAVRAAQTGNNRLIIRWILATMLLGSVFLGVKVVEYKDKYDHQLVAGPMFEFDADYVLEREAVPAVYADDIDVHDPQFGSNVHLFYSFYFVMTGMHALHMIIGIGVMIWLLVKAYRKRFGPDYYSPVEMTGLYWHFVDIVWIFLFPMLYLMGRH